MRRWIGWLFLLAGLLLVSYPLLKKIAFDRQQQQLLATFEQLGEMGQADMAVEMDPALPSQEPTAPDDGRSSMLDGARGLLKIPGIDLEMIIFDGASETDLDKGAGMIEPKKQFDRHNIGLAGHRSVLKGQLFNRLGELREGDEITVDTTEETLRYTVIDTFVVHQSDISVLNDAEKPLLTLVTCTPLGKRHSPNRLIVQAELQDVAEH
ncbi:class D sortase [Bacillus sp. OxB-1]|uniref:class D sortase n=1 Tax=Bacillus sp. (strain OxB-1) TaxID=98228 RepID=UPI000696EED2|nr:class D sortase [Bacillus sp. OxB-1]